MNLEMAPTWLFWLVGLLCAIQFGRFGVLVAGNNAHARRGMNVFTLLIVVPTVIFPLKPEALPQLSALILWTREHLLMIYLVGLAIGEVLIRRARTLGDSAVPPFCAVVYSDDNTRILNTVHGISMALPSSEWESKRLSALGPGYDYLLAMGPEGDERCDPLIVCSARGQAAKFDTSLNEKATSGLIGQ